MEDKGPETGNRLTTTGVNQDREETVGHGRTEETNTGVEGEDRTEERKDLSSGTAIMATKEYTKNRESPLGKEIYLRQWDTLVFRGGHVDNEYWRLVEDRNWQVGYVPVAFLVVIVDTTEGEAKTREGTREQSDENRIGQEGERRRKLFSGSD